MRVWAPLPGKAVWYFVWAYFIRLGFLDGGHGLRFHAMHAMYKQFDELKLWELRHRRAAERVEATPAAESRPVITLDHAGGAERAPLRRT